MNDKRFVKSVECHVHEPMTDHFPLGATKPIMSADANITPFPF
jgi:hypothetical protein